MAKKKKKTWEDLKYDNCPKCKAGLSKDMFGNLTLGCQCGFIIKQLVRDVIVERDYDNN